MQLDCYALTCTGRRASNEDAVCARAELGLFVVADGMGGYEGGEVASRLAVETIEALVRRTAADRDVTWPYPLDPRLGLVENEILAATRHAGEQIAARRQGRLIQMGSTVAVVRLAGDRVVIAHVGDSRVYRRRAGVVEQLTADHSLYAQLLAIGAALPPADEFSYRHVVTRALGTEHAEPDLRVEPLAAGDVYLLCSDGLSEAVSAAEMAILLDLPAEAACRQLVARAYAAGSRDNISAVVVRVLAASGV
jgi:PPM family protein phosphatase